MNTELIIISILLVCLVFLPFILVPFVQNRGSKNLKNKFRDEAVRLGLNIDLKENWSCNFIGIDTNQKKLLFVQKIEENFISEFVDLATVKQSRVVVTEIHKKNGKKEESELQKLDLEFSFFGGQGTKLINLYDRDINFAQDLELKHAEKWNTQIAGFLNSQPLLKKSA
ncbi:hypothetical protein LZ575_06285 [Antarcticibacterium sp. 1MA-6-2]|uniref:hypothetical protein n=1 Tax=Antarcticibacterium sp. 1MA-6-2 TaxID=2908210 RepID=UPI001F3B842A|nr:hypothetical protein [Antarcticibacterium sp. 1MA-6-2]UJH92180.1 hypothetical protein LZ575_06285 [Antarcticibacterium sp. 1MA-6-2]